MSNTILEQLAAAIRARRAAHAENSYTRQLLDGGPQLCSKKLGEEAVETIIAALGEDKQALARESADLLYHLLVLLECREVDIAEVLAVLSKRMGVSGLAEKAARDKTR